MNRRSRQHDGDPNDNNNQEKVMRTRYLIRSSLLTGTAALAVVLSGCAAANPDGSAVTADSPAPSDSVSPDAEEEHGAGEDHAEAAPDATPQDDAGESADGDARDTTDTAGATTSEVDGKPVIEIDMLEFAYAPDAIELQAGEPTILRFTNRGQVEHEAMLGDQHMQEEFAASDDHGSHGDDGGDGHHGDTMAVTVAAGDTVDLEVVIEEPGTWYVGCHLPGHYDAGMEAPVTISG